MRILVTGASGWIGSASVTELIAAGHHVLGPRPQRRSAAKVAQARRGGGARQPRRPRQPARRGRAGRGVVHLGYNHDFSQMARRRADRPRGDRRFADVLQGTGGPLLIASGTARARARPASAPSATCPAPHVHPRIANAAYTLGLADRGIRSIGRALRADGARRGGDHGFVAVLARIAREKGVSAYIGDGQPLAGGERGSMLAGSFGWRSSRRRREPCCMRSPKRASPRRDIAAASGTLSNCRWDRSPCDRPEHFGWLGMFFGAARRRRARARATARLGPTHVGSDRRPRHRRVHGVNQQ